MVLAGIALAAFVSCGLILLLCGVGMARSAILSENDAEQLVLSRQPFDAKWHLVGKARALRQGLAIIVIGGAMQAIGFLMSSYV